MGKKRRFWAFGLGPPAKIVGKSQGKRKNNALGKMPILDLFLGPWMAKSCQKRRPCFDMFPNVSCVFFCIFSLRCDHDLSLFYFPYLLISSYFTTKKTQHITQHTHSQTHTLTHTCTPATDRDLESGLSKSNTRKNPRKCMKKAKSGESLAKARFGQIVRLQRSGEGRIEPYRSWFPPKFPSFSGKSD